MDSYESRWSSKERRFVGVCCMPICYGERFEFVHRLPSSQTRRQVWLEALNEPSVEQLQYPSICGRHFRTEDYVHPEAHQLNRVAVPSLNLKDLTQLNECRKVRSYMVKQGRGVGGEVEESIVEGGGRRLMDVCRRGEKEKGKGYNEDQNEFQTINDLEASLLGPQRSSSIEELTFEYEEVGQILHLNTEGGTEVKMEVEVTKQAPAVICVPLSGDESDTLDICSDNDNTSSIKIYEENLLLHHWEHDEPLILHFLSLRDACKCADCYDFATRSRIIDACISIQRLNLRVNVATLSEHQLQVKWNDGHKSSYTITDLIPPSYHSQKSSVITNRFPWTSEHARSSENFTAITFNDIICYGDLLKSAFDRLKRYGVLLISEICEVVQQKPLMLELLLRRMLPNVDQHWTKEERTQFHIAHQLPHTNCTFLSESCGLQILNLSPNCVSERLELTVVDGLMVAQELRENSPESFNFFTQNKIPLIYHSAEDAEYVTQVPMIQLCNDDDDGDDHANEIHRIQFAPYHRGGINTRKLLSYHQAYDEITSIIKREQLQWRLPLGKNDLIILDNWRILWKADLSTYETHMPDMALDCVYVDRKHLLSRLKFLQID